MKTLHYIPILIILFLSACTSDETPFPPEPDGQGNVTFVFKAGSELTTRTVLNSSDNRQHVEKVHLYIFSGIDEAATCQQIKEMPWPKPGDVGYVTTERSYSIVLAPGAYTFLAIGLDDKSGTTYNLPAAVAIGSTLANAKAALASGQTRTDIAQSELYAGFATAPNVQASGNAAVTIDLWRRVAGVMGWFKNIPTQINNIPVSKVQIAFYTQQNKSGYLKAQELEMNSYPYDITNPANFKDYITDPISTSETDKIVATMDVPANIDAATVLSAGSYMLPAAAPSVGNGTEYTLRIELIGSDGSVLKAVRVKTAPGDPLYINPTGSGTGIIDTGGPCRFPIVANHFYSIGTSLAPVDLGGGDDIVLTVNPDWKDIVIAPLE